MTQDTRTALLDAAESVIRRRGYDGFSYADLAHVVGIRKASIHYHFPKKSQLVTELMARYHKKVLEHCDTIDAASPTGAAKLLGLIEFYRVATAGGQQLCLCAALSGTPESLGEDVSLATNRFRGAIVTWLELAFSDAKRDDSVKGLGPTRQEAPALLAVLEGGQLAARASQKIAAFDQAVAQFQSRCRT